MKLNHIQTTKQQSRPPALPTARWARNRLNMAIFTACALVGGLLAVALALGLVLLETTQP